MNGRATISMTPLVDIVFLLIIFFLVSGHLARRELRQPMEVPESSRGTRGNFESRWLTLHVVDDQTVHIDTAIVPPALMAERFREHIDRFGDQAAVRFRADRQVLYGTLAPLLREAAACGMTQVTVATTRQNEPAN